MADEHALAWAEPVAIATLIESLGEQGRGDEADAVLAERELTRVAAGHRARRALPPRARAAAARAGPARGGARRLPPRRRGHGALRRSTTRRCRAGGRAPRRRCCALGRARRGARAGRGGARARAAVRRAPRDRRRAAGPRARGGATDRAAARGGRRRSTARRRGCCARARSSTSAPRCAAAGERAASREPLREGLDLAHRCGAALLADHAEQELAASGARPRRRAISGIEALTPSQLRIATMAAEGAVQPRDRPGAVPQRPHRREPAAPGLRKARHRLASRARRGARPPKVEWSPLMR